MNREPTPPDGTPPLPALLYRSEAFAEDLDGQWPDSAEPAGGLRRALRPGWLFALPLAVLLIGSVSALAWA